jgi:acyl dehydratase
MSLVMRFDEIDGAVGRELGPTDWVVVDQETVNAFAEATGDHQWIHVDVERAKAGPFGGTIAHGYLTLSMMPRFIGDAFKVTDSSMMVNYGADKLRFTNPVPVGAKVRMKGALASAEPKGAGKLIRLDIQIEVEGVERPALVASILFLAQPPAA